MPRFTWIITLPLAVLAVVFAVTNRQAITVSLWPLERTIELPLYLVGLVLLGIGLIAGAVIGWLSAAPARRRARRERERARRLTAELEATRRSRAEAEAGRALAPAAAVPPRHALTRR